MTKVDFYTGSEDKLRTACQLSHKAMQNGVRVVLSAPDAATADALDKLLWQLPATAFIPHCRSDDAGAGEMPVVLNSGSERFPHHDLLISLHDECVPFFSRFERVIEIVSQEAEDSRRGRERYKFYKDRGYELSHTDLSKPRA
ncbi:DNA polymerase III subunit chi [Ferrigenium kumadai]|uniref:DNA polymerase III subunit chi n=1 Tax=Ferrigenium kumadai TaxID=1682490 RepID=A0AAN1SZM8_9PROT|nr:DNA polymerase III subunit chi [Ferrigenium kumadai]BBJ00018.1 DNA polymerase III subunit chi [Ferrigenium kumadai]